MGQTTDFMVAIELGSTRITGIAGQRDTDGKLSILAYASEDASACIRKGTVFNIDRTAGAITSIINKETGIQLRSININSNDGLFSGVLTVMVDDTAKLEALIRKLRTVKGVKQIDRG